jgi:phage terminase large subunit
MTFANDNQTSANDNVDAPLVIPYRPRRHFLRLHASQKRWIFACCHRRAGKTVAIANHLIRAAYLNPRQWPPPRYGYVGPSFEQAKDLVWSYLKQYTSTIDGVRFLEGELAIVLPHNGAIIKLYGGMSAYERMRGMYFDGIALDEYPLLQKTVFSSVVRPALADYRGWAIVSGTSNGDDHFNALRLRAMADEERWDVFLIPLSETGEEALSYAEAKELTQDMSADEYAREMECSFDAPVEGAYYADALNMLALQGRVCKVPVDLAAPVITSWDLGVHDYCSIWSWQNVGREVHFVDYVMGVGKGLDYWAQYLKTKKAEGGFQYQCHLLPHDIEAREISTAKSRRATLQELIPHSEPIITVPRIRSKEDGINASRAMLGSAYFDEVNCKTGLAMLRGYHKSAMGLPVHGPGPHSHGADAFQTAAVGFHLVTGLSASMLRRGAMRRKIRGIV